MDANCCTLPQGVVNHYGPSFLCLASSLEKLNSRQEILTVGVQEQADRVQRGRAEQGLEHMASVTLDYRNRLVRLREEMAGLQVWCKISCVLWNIMAMLTLVLGAGEEC